MGSVEDIHVAAVSNKYIVQTTITKHSRAHTHGIHVCIICWTRLSKMLFLEAKRDGTITSATYVHSQFQSILSSKRKRTINGPVSPSLSTSTTWPIA